MLKGQILEIIEHRHAAERTYQTALAEWQAATAEPEHHAQWARFYANALQDALRKANARRKELLAVMTQDDWRPAVHREMQADLWYEEPEPNERPAPDAMLASELPSARRNGNGTHPKVTAAVSGAVSCVEPCYRNHRPSVVGGACAARTPAVSRQNGSVSNKPSMCEIISCPTMFGQWKDDQNDEHNHECATGHH